MHLLQTRLISSIFILAIFLNVATCLQNNIECFSALTQADCRPNEILVEGAGLLGACPACKTGIIKGEECENGGICAPGLVCKKRISKENKTCNMETDGCFRTRHINKQITLLPFCEPDNTFSAVQCKGDRVTGRCFCSTETGEKIFGWDWWWNVEKMTCACSQWRHKLEEEGFSGVFLHCSQNGNYEEVQCTTKFCWCAEPNGELKQGTRIVPQKWWKQLPCCKTSFL